MYNILLSLLDNPDSSGFTISTYPNQGSKVARMLVLRQDTKMYEGFRVKRRLIKVKNWLTGGKFEVCQR